MAGRGRRLATGAIVGIAIAGFLFIAFWVLCCYCCCFRKKRQSRGRSAQPVGGGGGGGMLSRFMPGRQRHSGPAMMEAGHGGYGHGHHGVSRPQPTHGYR
ncbi:hypothetical protein Cob_v012479 [Colletotrichum orbiculare MAFF 240422]|uniref:Uncharacterized protein n=1 Tax=Colletotrichum orbiculare (strain 104-T / ATCC 96160 / CBS 514.97 / LARS 414 / MAFF 240422) TaxID=1213857 RepID=N4V1I1_COLOR|nr:hypothetical protein Cob_v012479 [Colletotrichum orbiculare MAFF 240422]